MTIDWNGKLEAVHADGRVVAVRLDEIDHADWGSNYTMTRRVDPEPEPGIYWFNEDGSHSRGGWSIRNVVEEKKEDGMTKFKVGDRVRAGHDAGERQWFVAKGMEGLIVRICGNGDQADDIEIQWDDRDDSWYYGAEDIQLIEQPAAPAFKVGDRVGSKKYSPEWSDLRVVDMNGWPGYSHPVRCERVGDGAMGAFAIDDLELITPATDELAELRAWKDAAIAKHPDLAPVDPDLLAARNVFKLALEDCGYADSNPKVVAGIDDGKQDDAPPVVEVMRLLAEARANPR